MRLRTLALALALGCGLSGMAEARHKPHMHKAKTVKSAYQANRKFKQARSRRVKPRKVSRRAVQRRKTH